MKHIYIFIFIINALLSSITCYGLQAHGIIQREVELETNAIQHAQLAYVRDRATYAAGGTTFTYPIGLFSLAPLVNVSIQPIDPHPTTTTYTVEINSNNATSTSIMVYEISGGTANEAANGSVVIYLFAIEDHI